MLFLSFSGKRGGDIGSIFVERSSVFLVALPPSPFEK
jgi:hypothetical protein